MGPEKGRLECGVSLRGLIGLWVLIGVLAILLSASTRMTMMITDQERRLCLGTVAA